ncbi:MAG: hypothetical protein N2170_08140 [Bacteroidia bacterium]|nr:hypothetical protein [Bacteroidia bacterium]
MIWILTPSERELRALMEGLSPSVYSSTLCASTGVGAVATLHHLWHLWQGERPRACIVVGIAGSYRKELRPPTLVYVQGETWGDLGKRLARKFSPTPLELRGDFPLRIRSGPPPPFLSIPIVEGLTLHSVSGTAREARFWYRSYPYVSIETQENAAYFLFAQTHRLPLLSFRIISNQVGHRLWFFAEALEALRTFASAHVAPLCEWLMGANSPSYPG